MAENLARIWGARIGVTHAENLSRFPYSDACQLQQPCDL
jgi:hypothetical protein